MKTILYRNGGDVYLGEHENQNIKYWKYTGKIKGQKWMYKGYRRYMHGRDIVIVFDTKQWNEKEKAKRRTNGFLGIREFELKGEGS